MYVCHAGNIENTILYRDIIGSLPKYSFIAAPMCQQHILRNGGKCTETTLIGDANRSQHIANALCFGHMRYRMIRIHIFDTQNFQQQIIHGRRWRFNVLLKLCFGGKHCIWWPLTWLNQSLQILFIQFVLGDSLQINWIINLDWIGTRWTSTSQPTWCNSRMTGCSGNIFSLFLSYILSNASYQNLRRICAIFSSETLSTTVDEWNAERGEREETK